MHKYLASSQKKKSEKLTVLHDGLILKSIQAENYILHFTDSSTVTRAAKLSIVIIETK